MAAPMARPPLAEQYRRLRERSRAGRPADVEALLRGFYLGFLRPGDVALDLGAFKGTHTLPLAEAVRGEGGVVHALEPNPACAAALRRRCADPRLAHVVLHEAAAALEDGEADFVLALDSPGYSGLRRRTYDQPEMRTRGIRVRALRLDTLFAALPRLAFIKADLEGGEFDAFRGGAALIERTRPAIGFEFGRRAYAAYGVEPAALFDWFAARGYVLFDIIGNPLRTRERFLRADSTPGLYEYLAVPAERRDLQDLARGLGGRVPAITGAAPCGPGPPARTRHLIVPGLAKAGTTFLFDQLAAQPDLFGRAKEKEIGYFTRRGPIGREGYLALFPARQHERVLLDATPGYIQNGDDIAHRIRAALPDDEVQVAILLRDPLDAMFSHYLHDLKSTIGRPSWTGARPARHSLEDPATLERYLRPRRAAVAAFAEVFGTACRGFHMSALFDGSLAAALRDLLGLPVRGFDTAQRSNRGGFVPGYLHGGAAGLRFAQDGATYGVPPGALVFAAEERSELHRDVDAAEVEAFLALGASFTAEITLPLSRLQPLMEDYLAMCATLGLQPAMKSREQAVRFAAPRARISERVLALLPRG